MRSAINRVGDDNPPDPVGRVRMVTVVIHILLWLSSAPGSTLSTENTVPVSNAGSSSGASRALAVVNPSHHDLIRWIDLEAGGRFTYNEWKEDRDAPEPLRYEHVHSENPLGSVRSSPRVAVMVNADLWEPLEASLELHALDLAGEGFGVDIYTVSGGIPQEMRSLLQLFYAEGLKGAVFVGDLPIAWYEMDGCYDPPYPFHLEFPCDFFYMDMNGVFQDTDADGLYDLHTGDRAPEIWIGRLTASPLIASGLSEIELLENYFRKNHLYRRRLAPLAHRGLTYIDDEFIFLTYHLNILQTEFIGGCTAINDPWTTWDAHYENTLTEPHELIHLHAHSNPVSHGFTNPAGQWSFTYNWEIPAVDPRVYFYILCACSNARYTTTDYMAGWYIFSPSYGLSAIGNTTLGSMIYCHDFYPSLGYQKPIGEAYLDWFLAQAAGGFWKWEECYYYGLTLLGDATLRIQEKSNSKMIQYDNEWGGSSVCLPNAYGMDFFNTRFTTDNACALSAVLMLANPWSGAPTCRIYVWNSDGTFPTSKIDSIDVRLDPANIGRWTWVDVSGLGLRFSEGEDFHVGFTTINLQPGERVDMHAGVPVDSLPMRSSLMYNGEWILFDDLDPEGHNFDIRVVVIEEPEPAVEITTLMLPHASLGQHYNQTLEVAGGVPPYFWDLTAGHLPDGITLDSPTGVISGQPTGIDTAHFTVRVTDSSTPPLTDIQHLTLVTICVDSDEDGIIDSEDNCPHVYNPDQAPVDIGNIDCVDGIDVLDVLAAVKHILGTDPLTGEPLDRADCNVDGSVNVLDALSIVNIILGIIPGCPGDGYRPEVTPKVVAFCQSLKSHLSRDDFSLFMALVKAEIQTPSEYDLSQNYPNPFNPVTSITYALPEAARVKVAVYNTLGRVVKVLVDSEMEAGNHTVSWNSENDASGIYFYRIVTKDFIATKRMVLMK